MFAFLKKERTHIRYNTKTIWRLRVTHFLIVILGIFFGINSEDLGMSFIGFILVLGGVALFLTSEASYFWGFHSRGTHDHIPLLIENIEKALDSEPPRVEEAQSLLLAVWLLVEENQFDLPPSMKSRLRRIREDLKKHPHGRGGAINPHGFIE